MATPSIIVVVEPITPFSFLNVTVPVGLCPPKMFAVMVIMLPTSTESMSVIESVGKAFATVSGMETGTEIVFVAPLKPVAVNSFCVMTMVPVIMAEPIFIPVIVLSTMVTVSTCVDAYAE